MRRAVFSLASLGALFAAIGTAAKSAAATIDTAEPPYIDAPTRTRRRKKGKGRGTARNLFSSRGRPSFDYERRQYFKKRWLEGKSVPSEMREAFEEGAARMAPKLARRAYAWRRQEEGKLLTQECEAYYARLREHEDNYGRPGGAKVYDRHAAQLECGWGRIKALLNAWDAKTPLSEVTA